MQELDERDHTEELFIGFAQFEERAKEAPSQGHPNPGPLCCVASQRRPAFAFPLWWQAERARVLYKYALQTLPKSQAAEVYKKYVQFEKQHADRKGIEEVITSKKRCVHGTPCTRGAPCTGPHR